MKTVTRRRSVDSPFLADHTVIPPPVTDAPPAGKYLEYLSRTAIEFVNLPPETDVYRHIASRLWALLGDAIVAVASYDRDTRVLCQRALVGAGPLLDAASSLARTKLRGFSHVLNAEAEKEINVGRLMKVEEGLYEALLRAIPRSVTRTIEKLGGIRAVYGMGCVANGECLGSILVLLRADSFAVPASVVETYINQAALALLKARAESVLRRSEEHCRALMEQASDSYFVLTTDGTILDVNPGTCKAMGYSRKELLGRRVTDFMDPKEIGIRPLQIERVLSGESFVSTRRIRRADGSYAVFESNIARLGDGHVLVTARDITGLRRLEQDVIEVGQRERQAVGRDLHDSLGQKLSGISFLCAGLANRLAEQGLGEADDAKRIAGLLRESICQTRRIARGLCLADLASDGVAAALAGFADHIGTTYGVGCRFVQSGNRDLLFQDARASQLYMIAQEASSNAIRHGKAKNIVIELNVRPDGGELRIQDDGCGFLPLQESAGGLGLRIMRYRAEMMHGTLRVESSPGNTAVTCLFPAME